MSKENDFIPIIADPALCPVFLISDLDGYVIGNSQALAREILSLREQLLAARADAERHASLDYWAERGRAAEAERDRLKLEIAQLRQPPAQSQLPPEIHLTDKISPDKLKPQP